jgi:hypothetical protein
MFSGCCMDVSIVKPSPDQNAVEAMINALESGVRVQCPKPPNARISEDLIRTVYDNVASQCWLPNPHDRPSFLSLVTVFRDYLAKWRECGRVT